MGIISTIKEMLGIDEPRRSPGSGTTVTVERERAGSRDEPSRAGEASSPGEPAASAPEPSVPEAEPESPAVEEEAVEEEPTPSAPATPATGEPVETITGIGPAYAERLGEAGIETVDQLAAADAGDLADETDIPESRVQEWIDLAQGSD